MKTKFMSRMTAVLLTVIMCVPLLPQLTLATDAVTADVFVSYQNDGYVIPKQSVTVASDLSDAYGYTDYADGSVSALDVLIKTHEIYFNMYADGGDFADWLGGALEVSAASVSSAFDGMAASGNIMTAIDGEMPYDTSATLPANAWGPESYLALSIPEITVADGSYVEFLSCASDWYDDGYTWFENSGGLVRSLAAEVGEEIDLSLVGYPYMSYGAATNASYRDGGSTDCEDLPIVLLNPATGEVVKKLAEADEDGNFSVAFDKAGTYILSAQSDAAWYQYIFAPWMEITVGPRMSGLQINTIGFGLQSSSNSPGYTAALDPDTLVHGGLRTDSSGRASVSIIPEFDDDKYTLTSDEDLTLWWIGDGGNLSSGPQLEELENGKEVRIAVSAGTNEIKLILTDKNNADNFSEYIINVLKARSARPNALSVSGAAPYPAFPLINGFAEGALIRYTAVGNLGFPAYNPMGSLGTSAGFAAATFGYHAYLTSDSSIDVSFGYAANVNAYARVTVGNGAPQIFDAAGTDKSFSVNSGILTVGSANNVKVYIETCSKDTYDENEGKGFADPFVAEDAYIVILEKLPSVSAEDLNALKLQSLEISTAGAEFGSNGFGSDSSVASVFAPPSTAIAFVAEAEEGVSVYKAASLTDANLVTANDDGKYEITTTASATSQVIAASKVIDGVRYTYTYTVTIVRKPTALAPGGPDGIESFIVPASQYSNAATGLFPEKLLYNTMLSLGNFGGHITVKYDTPIVNDPEHPYGVDFTVYGNSFGGSGASEPGNVWVSKDGEKWYLLAGSDYFDDNTVRDFEVTYKRNADGTSSYTDNKGNSGNPGTMYKYPLKTNYPLYDWQEDDEISFRGPLLSSSAADPYGSASAAFPAWGYPDVHSNGTVGGAFGNPYTLSYTVAGTAVTGANGNGGYGNGFDISWAVDEETGKPAELDQISYIKAATASHIYAGALGEKSTEVTAILRAPEASGSGMTDAPAAIKVNGTPLDLTAKTLSYKPDADGKVNISVEGAETVFINNTRGVERTYDALPESGIIRVVVQEGDKAARIYYLYSTVTVHVTIENTIFAKGDGAAWDGELLNTAVTIPKNGNIMNAIAAAIVDTDIEIEGMEINYITEINELSWGDVGAGPYSGWTIMLNDWFIHIGAEGITAEDGDMVKVAYSKDMGEDLDGRVGEPIDKSLKQLSISEGELSPEFSKDNRSYELKLSSAVQTVIVTPSASNKNYQVRTYIEGTEYKRSASVPVQDGTVITVICGEPSWPSMNNHEIYGDGSELVSAEVYTITIKLQPDIIDVTFANGATGLTNSGSIETVMVDICSHSEATLVAAVYVNDILFKMKPVTVTESGEIPVEMELPSDVSTAYVELMLWERLDTIKPLCKAIRITE